MNGERGEKYLGTKNIAKNGKTCKFWKDNNTEDNNLAYGSSMANASNYCRNVRNESASPWCYTAEIRLFAEQQPCDIPLCCKCRYSFYNLF